MTAAPRWVRLDTGSAKTAVELAGRWSFRDILYARNRKCGLTDKEQIAIREWRAAELNELPADERRKAWNTLQTWRPPLAVR
jgi:hypothetical protein